MYHTSVYVLQYTYLQVNITAMNETTLLVIYIYNSSYY